MRWLCIALVAASLVACKSDKSEKQSTTTGGEPEAAPPTKSADAAAAEPAKPAKPAMLNKMKECPSAIRGAHTTVEKTDGGVAVLVIGKDNPAVATIRERANKLVTVVGKPAGEPVHDGTGRGGALGKCPSRAPGAASAEVAEIDHGVKITFKLADPAQADAVFEALNTRAKELNDRGGRPHGSGGGRSEGGGHGGHGSNGQGGNR